MDEFLRGTPLSPGDDRCYANPPDPASDVPGVGDQESGQKSRSEKIGPEKIKPGKIRSKRNKPESNKLGENFPARRRNRRRGRKSLDKIQATPQTLAKLHPAPWAEWGIELQRAAQEINLAFRLITAGGLVQARDWQLPMGAGVSPIDPRQLTPYAERLIKRFRHLADLLPPADLSFVIDVVVQGEQPVNETAAKRLQGCLELYGKAGKEG